MKHEENMKQCEKSGKNEKKWKNEAKIGKMEKRRN